MKPTTIAIIALLVAWVVFTYLRYKKLSKDVNALSKLLYADKNPQAYIDKCQELVNKTNPKKRDYDINLLQRSTGEMFAGEFQEAINTLENDMKKIPMNGQHLYYQNLLFSYFFDGQIERGHAQFLEGKESLEHYKKTPANADGIEFIFAIDEVYSAKNTDEFKDVFDSRTEFFEEQSENGRNPYRQALASYILVMMYEKLGETEKLKKHLDICVSEGKNSFMEKRALEILNSVE